MSLPSPCINVCRMDEANAYCEGCFRTIPEITEWSGASEARQQEIMDLIAARQAALFDGPTAGTQLT